MFNIKLCSSICDWDSEYHKQDVNNHANTLGTLDVIYHLQLLFRLSTDASLTMIFFEMPIIFFKVPIIVTVNHTRSTADILKYDVCFHGLAYYFTFFLK